MDGRCLERAAYNATSAYVWVFVCVDMPQTPYKRPEDRLCGKAAMAAAAKADRDPHGGVHAV